MSKRAASSSSATSQQSKKTKTQKSLSGFFTSSTTAKKSSTSDNDASTVSSSTSKYKVFCDLDGVLVDFDAGVKQLFNGRTPDQLPNQGMMWGAITKSDKFYAKLPWTSDGKILWDELKVLEGVDILTGVPRANKSRAEKFAWCKTNLEVAVNHVDMAGKKSAHEVVTGRRKNKAGVVNVITCWSRNKHCESKSNHVLIDDRLSLRDAWEERGGIFIHHTETERTLSMLREKGILESKKGGKTEE